MQSKPASLPPWGNAVAGATGAVVANALVYPLDMSVSCDACYHTTGHLLTHDRVKTRLQVQTSQPASDSGSADAERYASTIDALRKIAKQDGIFGLYAGMPGSLIGVASTNFAYFYWYAAARSLYVSYQRVASPPTTAVELALGAIAGAIAQVFTVPVAVITTRQQTAPKHEQKGLLATGRDIVRTEDGWPGLWKGLKASLVLVVNPAITYGAFERLREVVFPGNPSLRPWQAFGRLFLSSVHELFSHPAVLGMLSKALATFVTQPLIVAKVVLQSKPSSTKKDVPFRSFGEVLRHIVKTEGVPALFKGIGPQLLKALLVQGLLMMLKERYRPLSSSRASMLTREGRNCWSYFCLPIFVVSGLEI